MTAFIVILCVISALILFYSLMGRSWLKTKPWAQGFFRLIEPVEIAFWRKSETILWNRFLMLAGVIPPILEQLEKLNVPSLQYLLPEQYQGWWTLTFTVIGIIGEYQRRDTTKPVEFVELPDDLSAKPKIAAVVEAAEAAKIEGVAVVLVEQAKADATAAVVAQKGPE